VRGLDRRLRAYGRPSLLCIDEIGYLSYDAHAADLLFQVVSRRYEQKSIVLTTNLAFKSWNTIFPNASCTVALIDRLTHPAEILTLKASRIANAKPNSRRKRDARRPRLCNS
jgi:DNA replication protein DnaC